MPFIYKIATININGISSANRILLLGEFLFQNDFDIALLQEVTTTNLTSIRNYTVFDNIGTDGRGTAILAKSGINLTDVKRLPSGRGIAASFFGTKTVNIYAPSGAEEKRIENVSLKTRFCLSCHQIAPNYSWRATLIVYCILRKVRGMDVLADR